MRTKLFFLLLIFSAFSSQLAAQHVLDDRIEGLQKKLAKAPADTGKVRLYLELISNYYDRFRLHGKHEADSLAFFQTLGSCRLLSQKLDYAYGNGSCFVKEARMNHTLQNYPIRDDRLQKAYSVFKAANDKAALAIIYIIKSEFQTDTDKPAKIRFCDTALRLAREAQSVRSEVTALKMLGDLHYQQGQYALAIQELSNVLELQKKSGDKNIVYTTDLLAQLFAVTGKHKQALQNAIATIDHTRKTGDTVFINTFYLRLAEIYLNLQSYEKAYYYFDRIKAYRGHTKSSQYTILSIIANMSICLIGQNKYQEAFDFFSRQLKTYQPVDSSSQDLVNQMYMNFHYYLGHYQEAEEYLLKEIRLESPHDVELFWQMEQITRAGQIYFELKQYDKAGWYADSGYAMARRLHSLSNRMENSLTLFKLDSIKGKYAEAIRHYQDYKKYSDSTLKEAADKRVIEMSVQYETDQKNNELALLNNKTQLQQKTIQQGRLIRNTMIAGSGLLLLLLLVIFNRYRVKQKANRSLQEKQEEINLQNQTLEKLVREEKKITTEKDKLLKEKEWLMKEINHRVKNNLQVVMSLLNTQSAYLKDEAALSAIQESRHRVHAISLIHRKLYQSDQQLMVIDMASYIKEVTEYLADSLDTQHRIRFGLYIDPIELDITQAVPTGLIINEAVTNAVKYAFPGRRKGQININMYRKVDGLLELTIQDNGVGLPEHFDWQQTESLGMSLIQGLSRQLDGDLNLIQQDGLTIKITFEPAKPLTS